jgi:Gametolysin peptidase M11
MLVSYSHKDSNNQNSMMKISIFFSSFWLLLVLVTCACTEAMSVEAAEQEQQHPFDMMGNDDGEEFLHRLSIEQAYPPRLRQQRLTTTQHSHHESRVLDREILVETSAFVFQDSLDTTEFVLEDSEDEFDLTSVICQIVEYDVQFADTEEYGGNETKPSNATDDDDPGPFHACFTDDSLMGRGAGSRSGNESGDQVYSIAVPPETLAQLSLDNRTKSFIFISKAIVNRDKAKIEIVPDALVSVVDPPESFARRLGRRQLSSGTGDNIILVLRVNNRGAMPSLTASQLRGRFFGEGPDKVDVSLKSQMQACSFGQLRYQAAQGDGIVGGIADIYISQNVGGDVRVLENVVLKQFNAEYDEDFKNSLSNLALVFPKNLEFQGRDWLGKYSSIQSSIHSTTTRTHIVFLSAYILFFSFPAYGYVNGYLTVFKDQWAGSFSAVAHEIGHNMNLHHSGRGTQPYGDISGLMGYGVTTVGAPASCFNAQKHFALKWFEARGGVRRLSMTDDLPWMGYLAFFGDYKSTAMNQPVVINIGSTKPRLFLQYNRAKGINRQTRMAADSVVIVRDDGSPEKSSGKQSWFAAALAKEGDSWAYTKFHGNFDLSIRLCKITSGTPDVVRLSIILNDGKQKHTCDKEMPPICDDNLKKTFRAASGVQQNCTWLRAGDTKNCVKGQEAYDVCAETCGKCTDDCEDTAGVDFFAGDGFGRKNCTWLARSPAMQEKLCRHGHAAFEHCKESCNRCDFP